MNPKDKANELFDKYYIICQEFTEEIQCSIQAKQCALIAVDEILKKMNVFIDLINDVNWSLLEHNIDSNNHYWKQVKNEIEKI